METYPYIPFIPDKKTVLRRMGAQNAQHSAGLEKEIDSYLLKAQSAFSVRGKAGLFDITHTGDGNIVLVGTKIESKLLARMLGSSTRVYLMCASIPQRDVDKISAAMESGQGLMALVFDAYASEYVDGALDVIMDRKNAQLMRTGRKLTKRRFSAGYGDLDIAYQRIFYNLLDMQTMEVNISDRYLLIPEKSVIAVAGVE